MKVSIYKEVPVENKEQEFLLQLQQCGEYIYLQLVGEDGENVSQGSIIRINPDMTITRCSGMNTRLGLTLNHNRQLCMVGVDG